MLCYTTTAVNSQIQQSPRSGYVAQPVTEVQSSFFLPEEYDPLLTFSDIALTRNHRRNHLQHSNPIDSFNSCEYHLALFNLIYPYQYKPADILHRTQPSRVHNMI